MTSSLRNGSPSWGGRRSGRVKEGREGNQSRKGGSNSLAALEPVTKHTPGRSGSCHGEGHSVEGPDPKPPHHPNVLICGLILAFLFRLA